MLPTNAEAIARSSAFEIPSLSSSSSSPPSPSYAIAAKKAACGITPPGRRSASTSTERLVSPISVSTQPIGVHWPSTRFVRAKNSRNGGTSKPSNATSSATELDLQAMPVNLCPAADAPLRSTPASLNSPLCTSEYLHESRPVPERSRPLVPFVEPWRMKPKAIAATRTISTIGRRTNAANLRNGTKPQSQAQTTINVATTTARQACNSDVNADIISLHSS